VGINNKQTLFLEINLSRINYEFQITNYEKNKKSTLFRTIRNVSYCLFLNNSGNIEDYKPISEQNLPKPLLSDFTNSLQFNSIKNKVRLWHID